MKFASRNKNLKKSPHLFKLHVILSLKCTAMQSNASKPYVFWKILLYNGVTCILRLDLQWHLIWIILSANTIRMTAYLQKLWILYTYQLWLSSGVGNLFTITGNLNCGLSLASHKHNWFYP